MEKVVRNGTFRVEEGEKGFGAANINAEIHRDILT